MTTPFIKRLVLIAGLLAMVACGVAWAAEAFVTQRPNQHWWQTYSYFGNDAEESHIVLSNGDGTGTDIEASELAILADGVVATTDIAPGFQQLLYAVTEASAAHTGATAAETTVAPAAADGSATIAVADLKAGAAFRWNVFVPADGDADGDETLTVNVYLGSQLIGTTGAIAVDGAIEFFLSGDVRIRTAGAAGTGIYQCVAMNGSATPAMDGATFSSFDTTATKAFTVKLDWGGTTDAADTAAVQDATLYVANFD